MVDAPARQPAPPPRLGQHLHGGPVAVVLGAGGHPPAAALLMPAGFFLSVLGRDPQRPSRLLTLVWLGGSVLAVGLACSGIGLIVAGAGAV